MIEARSPAAAKALIDATLAVAAAGVPLMERLVSANESFVEWDHYPADDAVDLVAGCRYFYHAHAAGERGEEHGHFHLFFERDAAMRDVRLLASPPIQQGENAQVAHLIAVAIDRQGLPSELFTVNRWVTDEWLLPASVLVERLPTFDLGNATGDPLINRWLTALVGFYAQDIAELLYRRDDMLSGWSADGFEDEAVEVLTVSQIHINDAVEAIS
jgi:hypothetical protein